MIVAGRLVASMLAGGAHSSTTLRAPNGAVVAGDSLGLR